MKVAVIGTGAVGQTLANGLQKHGHEVMIGTRDVAKPGEWKNKLNEKVAVGTMKDAAKFGELIVLAVKGDAAMNALQLLGGENLNGKVVIDTTNPITPVAPEKGVINYFTSMNASLMEQLQRAYPDVKFVKAFNSVGSARMVNPDFKDGKPSMFICGNDQDAKSKVKQVLDVFGWETEDMGMVEAARAIEPLAMLWCIPGFLRNEWSHAFKLVKV